MFRKGRRPRAKTAAIRGLVSTPTLTAACTKRQPHVQKSGLNGGQERQKGPGFRTILLPLRAPAVPLFLSTWPLALAFSENGSLALGY